MKDERTRRHLRLLQSVEMRPKTLKELLAERDASKAEGAAWEPSMRKLAERGRGGRRRRGLLRHVRTLTLRGLRLQ